MFAGSAVLATGDVFTAYLPVLGDQRGIAPSTIGVFLALRSAFSMTSRVGIVTIVRHVGRIRLIAFSSVAAAVALAGMAAVHDVVALAVLSAVVGAALGFGQPLSMTIVVQLVPQAVRGTALALRLTGNRLGQIGAPSVAGVVAGSAGTGAVFLLVGGLLVAAAAAVLVPVRQPLPVVPQSEP
jgi:sugar phosphate permease